MDLADKQNLSIDDYFEQSVFANRLFLNNRELSDHLSQKEAFDFNIQDSVDHFMQKEQIPLPQPLQLDECHSIRNDLEADDTDQFEQESRQNRKIDEFPELNLAGRQTQEKTGLKLQMSESQEREYTPSIEQLQKVISHLVEHSNQSVDEIRGVLGEEFGAVLRSAVVTDLIEKFGKLKKTKEELIKYCMRKAFKFILQLPKNKHLLEVSREEKFSFSKCKNRFLKKISQEKSMNNKFLQQIFHQKDFSSDYQLFLAHFARIIEEDNDKKVKYLAELLTTQKEGKSRTVQMVRRLPWTKSILQRVKKISRELLKYSDQS